SLPHPSFSLSGLEPNLVHPSPRPDPMLPFDWNLTWYTPHPDLSQCFQHTVLVWFPCMYLWSCGPLYLVYLWFTGQGGISLTSLCCAKTVLGLCLLMIWSAQSLLSILFWLISSAQCLHLFISLLILSLQLLAVCVIQWERMKGCRSSVLLFLFWTLAVVCSLVPLRANIQQIIEEVCVCVCVCVCVYPVCYPLQNPCPVEDASFLSKMLFWWFGGLVIRGYRTPLQAEDLWCLREEDSSDCIIADLEIDWNKPSCLISPSTRKECSLSGCRPTGPKLTEQTQLLKKLRQEQNSGFCLFRVLARSFGPFFLKGTLFLIFHDAFMFSIPQVLSLLLGFMCDQDSDLWKGFMFAFLLFLLSSLQSLFNHQYMYSCFTVGMRVKTAVMGLVYRKSLVISSAARQSCTVGEIVNLVSADTQKLMDMVVYFNAVWLAPIEIALCLYFLWQLLGPSALAGIATVILIFPLNGFIAKMRSKLQVIQMRYTDSRIKLMNEILSGIKILKFYAWEQAFLERVLGYREKELNALKRSQAVITFQKIAFSMFGVYVLVDDKNILDAQKVFVSMALIHILKTPLSQLPFAMSTTMQAVVSLRRLGKFLCQDELKPDDVDREPYNGDGVVIDSGTFGWSKEGPPCLMRINVRVKKGSLVAVVGHVGSGKSSLLSAMLGETEKRSGHVSVKGSVAYVPQQAWIQNATLKDNIVFGQERKESWYRRVVEACALLPDLEILPAGDGTEIGEKGLNLSGGQKQRVSLARAVYRKADVYLLDDPLSAVDTHVGQHIFERVFGAEGLLKDQTRVLVTHGLSFLPQADLILVLVEGEITEMGSYLELMARDGAFAEFIRLFAGNERKERSHRGEERDGTHSTGCNHLVIKQCFDWLKRSLADVHSKQTTCEVLGKLTEADKANTGRVKLEMYVEYFRTIGLALIIPIVFLYAFQQAASLAYNYWLSVWADDPIINGTQIDTDLKLGVFGALGFAQGVVKQVWLDRLAISLGGIIASRHLHLDLLNNVLRSPMAFFEVTPSGNLLNRFSKEVDAIDCMIPDGLKMMLGYLFKLLEVCIIVLVAMPFAGVVLLPLTLLYAFIQSFYVATSCQLRRLEAVSRSPIYTHFNETVQGASVVRAFSEQERFILQANGRIDHNQTAYFPRFVATRWLAVNLEFLGNLLVLAAATLAVMGRDTLSPGIVGLAVSHSLQVTGILSWIVRSWTDVENNIVSVERVKEYADTPKEAPWTIEGSMLPLAWPTHGTIELEEYGLQYRKGLDWALKGISLSIQEKEKVGIVGRTGAGKSSLALGIFRILEAAKGEIYIDGINIAQIGLHELRSRITIIPQDPVLFSGSLRMNLDPFDGYSDEEVWRALELSHLKSFVSCLPDKLNHECSEGGENLSLGQRQLVCLARALLRKTKILVLDEATAAVDLETDNLIQSTIRTQFDDCTVLTIAHRLNTIMDYTRVIVMDRGLITEMDSPSNLISERGQFYLMCREAGLV
uniref:ABC-type glutathione-S-conjugate transporter n=1 Tax=Oncorhynchus tshawytscha TaxID=74940 RepID=A0AAZ3S2E9_ONCTS